MGSRIDRRGRPGGCGRPGDGHDLLRREPGRVERERRLGSRRALAPGTAAPHRSPTSTRRARQRRRRGASGRRPPGRRACRRSTCCRRSAHDPSRTTGASYGHGAGISSTGSSPNPMMRSAASSNADSAVAPVATPAAFGAPVGDDAASLVRREGRDVVRLEQAGERRSERPRGAPPAARWLRRRRRSPDGERLAADPPASRADCRPLVRRRGRWPATSTWGRSRGGRGRDVRRAPARRPAPGPAASARAVAQRRLRDARHQLLLLDPLVRDTLSLAPPARSR